MSLKTLKRAWKTVGGKWLDARFGLIYTGFLVTFGTYSTVTYADIPQVKQVFGSFPEYFITSLVVGGLIISPAIGYLHRKYQNPIDNELANAPLFKKIREIVREELARKEILSGIYKTEKPPHELYQIDPEV